MTAIVPRPIRKGVVLEARARQLPQLNIVDAVPSLRRQLEHAPHILHHRPRSEVIVDVVPRTEAWGITVRYEIQNIVGREVGQGAQAETFVEERPVFHVNGRVEAEHD